MPLGRPIVSPPRRSLVYDKWRESVKEENARVCGQITWTETLAARKVPYPDRLGILPDIPNVPVP
jgi:hypothetical protein